MKQTFLSFILALLPIMASADANGTCGENLKWSFVESAKTLTISGTGTMYDYYNEYYYNYGYYCTSAPWGAYVSNIEIVIIESGVTSIGTYAFYGLSNLSTVSISNSVNYIGVNAFSVTGWYNSQSDGILYLENWLIGYKGAKPTGDLIISEGTIGIASYAFQSCSALTSVTIPSSVTNIGSYAFDGCGKLVSLKIQNGVSSIGSYAFQSCSTLTSVTIPNSVISIGSYAFSRCSSLTSVVIGSGVTSIGGYAFSSTNLKKTIWLTNTPPSGYSNASGTVNYVSNDKFSSLSNVTKYQFLSSYFDVDGIRYVPVSPSERTCDAIDCVYNESAKETKIASTVSYKGITMNVKNIKPYVAYSNPYIESLTVDNDGAISEYAFCGCKSIKSANIGAKVNSIGTYAFYNCSSLQSIVIPDAVLTLGDYTFSGCSAMTSAKIGNGVETINECTFSSCSSLKDLIIGSNVNNISSYAFSGCSSLPSITIPSAVTTINNSVFDNCSSLAKVIISDSETTLSLGSNYGNPFFSSCPLDTVYIGRDISYNKASNYGYSPFYRNTSLRAVKITDKETEISENEFYGCTNLQRVVIGDGVTTIGNWAFSGCQSLKFFAFGSQVANIGKEAFSDCTSVIEIISKAQAAPVCGSQALDDINKWDCMLYVPDGCMATYEAADQWKDFFFKEEGEGTLTNDDNNPNDPEESKKCETPTITITDGKIHFACATEGVTYTYHVTASDPSGVGNDIAPSSLTLTVYASKPGFENSDTATIEIAASSGVLGDLTGDGKVDVADHVKLSSIIMDQKK